MRALLYALATMVGILLAHPAIAETKPSRNCAEEDFITYVKGGGECIAVILSKNATSAQTLIIYLHGAVSRGGPADYLKTMSSLNDGSKVLGVTMIRLGYYTSDNRYSSGRNNRRRDNTTRHHNDAIAAAIDRLKSHYKAHRVIVVGHSAGALTAAAIIGRKQGLIDAAILVSCPCDTKIWSRVHKRRSSGERRENPMRLIGGVSTSTRVMAITGKSDTNTTPPTVTGYIEALAKNGVPAKFVLVPGAGHNMGNALMQATVAELRRLL